MSYVPCDVFTRGLCAVDSRGLATQKWDAAPGMYHIWSILLSCGTIYAQEPWFIQARLPSCLVYSDLMWNSICTSNSNLRPFLLAMSLL
jgi:hypothetical protein